MTASKMPTYFVSHGGGPWPWLKKEMPFFDTLEASLKAIPSQLGQKPKALLVISGHWEEAEFTVMSSPHPPMVYDYGGFPDHTYHIKYPAPGSPSLALRVQELIRAAGMPAQLDAERGFDHGAFVTAYAMYPNADVPMLQLSLKRGYDPATHIALGKALAPLRDEGVVILGSGLSYHNLRAMMRRDPAAKIASKAFDDWLQQAIMQTTPALRDAKLLQWSQAPSARAAHPEEDHLLPLMVAAGAAEGESAALIYHEEVFMGSMTASSFRFGEAVASAIK